MRKYDWPALKPHLIDMYNKGFRIDDMRRRFGINSSWLIGKKLKQWVDYKPRARGRVAEHLTKRQLRYFCRLIRLRVSSENALCTANGWAKGRIKQECAIRNISYPKPRKRSAKDEYYRQVDRKTEKSWRKYRHLLESNPRGSRFHLDHMYSKLQGFLEGVDPNKVGHPGNLRMLSALQNKRKAAKAEFSLKDLEFSCWIFEQEFGRVTL